jgi:broad-specificity NMP kinase
MHICITGNPGTGEALALDLASCFDALLHHAGFFSQAAVTQFFVFDARHLDVDVDAVE